MDEREAEKLQAKDLQVDNTQAKKPQAEGLQADSLLVKKLKAETLRDKEPSAEELKAKENTIEHHEVQGTKIEETKAKELKLKEPEIGEAKLVVSPPSVNNLGIRNTALVSLKPEWKLCVVMVGLPARGKSYVAQKAQRYLQWLSVRSETFNVGNYRRAQAPCPTADFFDSKNKDGERMRRIAAESALHDMLAWFRDGNGRVAFFDATNSTKERRKWVADQCKAESINVLFVESICDDEALVMANIRDVKTTSPDYRGCDPEAAVVDFRNRIRNYEADYKPINADGDEEHYSYLQLKDLGRWVIMSRIRDYLSSRIVYYINNLHIRPRSVWLSRGSHHLNKDENFTQQHGESMFNLDGRIGGDAPLSPRGELYAVKLAALVRQSVGDDRPLTVWTSTLSRTIATARHLPGHYNQLQWKALDELDGGLCDGMTYQEIKDTYPEDFAARDEDKYYYRYRGGESYRDVVIRLEPIIMELERSEDILIISHQAVLRCIYAYFMKKDQEQSPWMYMPLHTLIGLTSRAFGTDEERLEAHIPAVSTWRGKGSIAKHEDPVPGVV